MSDDALERFATIAFCWIVAASCTVLIFSLSAWLFAWFPRWMIYAYTLSFVLSLLGDPKVTNGLFGRIPPRAPTLED